MSADGSLRARMPDSTFAALGACTSADTYTKIVEQLFNDAGSVTSD